MEILIYGFGRMGLTHYTILNALKPDANFTIIEPNNFLNFFLKKNLKNIKFLKNDTSILRSFDLTLITAPPFAHLDILKKCLNRNDKKIFVEKPFGGYTNTAFDKFSSLNNVYIGYVLRFNPCIQWIKQNINLEKIKYVKGSFLSNTLEKKPVGWRNGHFSGVLNEVGSHIIDLIQYIIGYEQMDVLKSEKQSIVSDVDDILKADLKTRSEIGVSLYLNWVEKKMRKPVFFLEISMEDGLNYFIDQQQIILRDKSEKIIQKYSVTDISAKVPYYLRGIDFTKQMEDLIGNSDNLAKISEAISVNSVMKKIIEYENNFR